MPRAIEQFLWRQVDASRTRLFCIALGFAFFARSLHLQLFVGYFQETRILFPFWGMEWLPRPPGAGMHVVLALTTLGALGVMRGGRFAKASALLCLTSFSYFFFLDQSFFGHLNWLLISAGVLLFFLPTGQMRDGDRVPAWTIFAPRFVLVALYFFAGVVKLHSPWLDGSVIALFLAENHPPGQPPGFLMQPPVPMILAWGGALFDLLIGPLLLWRKTRYVAIAAMATFHISNIYLLELDILPVLFIILTFAAFAHDSHARRILGWKGDALEPEPAPSAPLTERVMLALFFTAHIVLPLRPYIYPGDSHWTHEAQHFSWWLRSTMASVEFAMFVESDGHPRRKINPLDYISPAQSSMALDARMIVRLAKHVARDYAARGEENVRVYADVKVAVDGLPSHRYIPAELDLSRVDETFHMDDVILPGPFD